MTDYCKFRDCCHDRTCTLTGTSMETCLQCIYGMEVVCGRRVLAEKREASEAGMRSMKLSVLAKWKDLRLEEFKIAGHAFELNRVDNEGYWFYNEMHESRRRQIIFVDKKKKFARFQIVFNTHIGCGNVHEIWAGDASTTIGQAWDESMEGWRKVIKQRQEKGLNV